MFVAFQLLDGSSKTIPAHSLIRSRPTVFFYEPGDKVMIQSESQQSFSREPLEALVERFAAAAPLVKLRMLDERPVYVSAQRVFEVSPPNSVIHNSKANAIVQFGAHDGSGMPLEGVFSSVLEDVLQVQ